MLVLDILLVLQGLNPRHMKISGWLGRDTFGQEQINLGTLGYALARADVLDPGSIALLFT